MKLSDFIRVYDKAVPEQLCDELIQLMQVEKGKRFDTDAYRFTQLDLMEGHSEKGIELVTQVMPLLELYMQEVKCAEFLPFASFENVRIKLYNPGDEFTPHVDVVNHETARRALVFIIYLNDNDGDTEFQLAGVKVTPKRGRMVVFPPLWMFPHSGKAPTSDKYIAMSCVHYT
jgi:hypothetical protein